MNRDWLDQEIQTVSNWRHQYWLASSPALQLVPDPEKLDAALAKSHSIYKDDPTTSVAAIKSGDRDFVLKRYNARSQGHKIKRAFRRSRARRCWTMSYHFQRAGLNVAAPTMMFEKRFGPIRSDAYFVNQYLQGNELLGLLPEMSVQQQREVGTAIKYAFEQMHIHKLSHGDMKASNLLWVDGELYFIDLDAARKHLSRFGWQAAHRKDKKRFFKNWRDKPELFQLFG